jgi:hypothetical protein
MIDKVGHLVDTITNAVMENGLTSRGDVFIREGRNGPERRIENVVVRRDLQGICIIIQTKEEPRQ